MTSLPFAVPQELFDVEHRFLDLAGTRLHYVDEGRGEILLLLHGNPSWSFVYRKIIAGLRGAYRCVALDYPGYGMSRAAQGYGFTPREHSLIVEQFVDRLGLRDLTLMGQDWGGPIGLGFAGRRPELVKRLVLGNTFAWPLSDQRRMRVFSAVMGGFLGRSGTWAFNLVPRFFIGRGMASALPPPVRAAYLAPWRARRDRRPAVIAPEQLIGASEFLREVEAGLAGLADRPLLLVWGSRDFAFGSRERARFEQLFPDHRTILFERASHFVQEDAGGEIADAMRRWLAPKVAGEP